MKRRVAISLVLVVIIGLSGCSTGIIGGPLVSDTETGVTSNGVPYLGFQYSVDDYATVLLENPDHQIVDEREVSPDENRSALAFSDPKAGTYTLVVRKGGETKVEKEIEFEGPDLQISSVDTKWSGTTLEAIDIAIENNGDLPVRLSEGSYTARGQTVTEESMYEWVDVNSTNTVTLSASYGESVVIEEPGEVRGSVRLGTTNATLTESFSKTFEGPNLTIESTEPVWEANDLDSVHVTVRNTGDMPTTANASIEHAGTTLSNSGAEPIAPGESTRLDITDWGYVYRSDSGGEVRLDLIVNGENEYLTETITHEVADASITIDSMSPNWENGHLRSVSVTVQNSGDVDGEPRIELQVDSEEISGYETFVSAGETREIEFGGGFGDLYTALSGGTVEVSVVVSGPDGSDSVSKSKSFEGIDAEISNVDATFYGNFDSDTSDLYSVNFDVRNVGDTPVVYDSIEFEIDGVSTEESMYSEQSIDTGESVTEYTSPDITVDNGEHTLTIRLLNDGETVASDSFAVTAAG